MSRPAARIVSPTAIAKQVRTKLGNGDHIPVKDKIVTGHFFFRSCDWYVTEYDPATDTAFGFCHLGDDQCAEWGYVSIAELRETTVPVRLMGHVIGKIGAEWDRYWNPVEASKIEKIVRSGGIF